MLRDDTLDPAFRAQVMALPTQSELAQALADRGQTPDPDAIHGAVEGLRDAMARHLSDLAPGLYDAMRVTGPYAPDAEQSGKRALGNAMLGLISRRDAGALAARQYAEADNMTLALAALACLLRVGKGSAELAAFHERWKDDRLVMDKWFALQIVEAKPESAVETAARLTEHPAFDWKNPNRFRAVMGALAGHHAGFHRADGAGYALLADWLIRLDPVNPQTAARMMTAFQTWRRYDAGRQAHAKAALERIAATPDLSRDGAEMVGRMLG
jgi:aminopeptidase N